jgi:hypothetical protein
MSLIGVMEPPEPFDYGDEVVWTDDKGNTHLGCIVGFYRSGESEKGPVDVETVEDATGETIELSLSNLRKN